MIRYSVQTTDQIFVKGYGFLSFTKNMGKNIGKNISKNLRGKYSQNLFDHAKQSDADALKNTCKRVIQKIAEANNDQIGTKIAHRITKVSKTSPQNNSETVTNEHDKNYLKKDIYFQKKIIDDLRLI